MKNISQEILKKIKERRIKPKPRWEFLLKDYLIWFFFGLSVLVGSLAVSVIIFMIKNINYPMKFHPAKMFLSSVPYFWIAILTVFLFLAYYNFKYTKKGYRYNPYLIIVASILISLVLGAMLYGLSFGRLTEKTFYNRFPVYRNLMNRQGRMMIAPNEGRLGGMIIADREDGFVLKSFVGDEWIVVLDNKSDYQDLIEEKERVMIIGQPASENIFKAKEVLPVYGPLFPERKR